MHTVLHAGESLANSTTQGLSTRAPAPRPKTSTSSFFDAAALKPESLYPRERVQTSNRLDPPTEFSRRGAGRGQAERGLQNSPLQVFNVAPHDSDQASCLDSSCRRFDSGSADPSAAHWACHVAAESNARRIPGVSWASASSTVMSGIRYRHGT